MGRVASSYNWVTGQTAASVASLNWLPMGPIPVDLATPVDLAFPVDLAIPVDLVSQLPVKLVSQLPVKLVSHSR
jgi:hypothetical protein